MGQVARASAFALVAALLFASYGSTAASAVMAPVSRTPDASQSPYVRTLPVRVAGLATQAGWPPAATAATEASATTPTVVPDASRIAAAARWMAQRRGFVGFAVMDSAGKLAGYHIGRRFITASVVKAMLLVGYLRTHRTLSSWARSTLTNMIHVSDNNAASAIYGVVGDAGLRKVAKAAGMTGFSVPFSWGRAILTPADQARFFFRMDSLVPTASVPFARRLLSHITTSQSWGIPALSRPAGWTVFFKGGWRTTWRGQLVHQAARLEKDGTTFSVAIMTDGDPSMAYGIGTIRGVMKRLLGQAK
jgi:hypothetical protein